MPRIEFSEENKVATTNYDYPKLKLKSGERARIIVGLEAPVGEYVHTLRAPQIINGVPQMETITRKDKSTYEGNVMDFVSRPICIGDASVLADKGLDAKNCPMCKLALEQPDMTQAPQLRYAMHVIRYRTKSGGFELVNPYSVETLVWSFTGRMFNKIADFKKEFTDLRKFDLLLGPCTNEGFQQFDVSVGAKAEWLTDPERQKVTALTFKENQIPDLAIACGSIKEKRWIDEDVAKVRQAWAEASGKTSTVDAADATSLDADLNDLMGSSATSAGPDVAAAGFEDLLGTGAATTKDSEGWHVDQTDIDTAKAEAPGSDLLDGLLSDSPAEPETAAVAASADTSAADSFEDLLKDM